MQEQKDQKCHNWRCLHGVRRCQITQDTSCCCNISPAPLVYALWHHTHVWNRYSLGCNNTMICCQFDKSTGYFGYVWPDIWKMAPEYCDTRSLLNDKCWKDAQIMFPSCIPLLWLLDSFLLCWIDELNHETGYLFPSIPATLLGQTILSKRLVWFYAWRWSRIWNAWTCRISSNASMPISLSMPPPGCSVLRFR